MYKILYIFKCRVFRNGFLFYVTIPSFSKKKKKKKTGLVTI